MSFKVWQNRADIPTWMRDNEEVMEACRKAYAAGEKRSCLAGSAREAARLSGQKKYIGKPCKHGHDGVRYTSTADCVECCT